MAKALLNEAIDAEQIEDIMSGARPTSSRTGRLVSSTMAANLPMNTDRGHRLRPDLTVTQTNGLRPRLCLVSSSTWVRRNSRPPRSGLGVSV